MWHITVVKCLHIISSNSIQLKYSVFNITVEFCDVCWVPVCIWRIKLHKNHQNKTKKSLLLQSDPVPPCWPSVVKRWGDQCMLPHKGRLFTVTNEAAVCAAGSRITFTPTSHSITNLLSVTTPAGDRHICFSSWWKTRHEQGEVTGDRLALHFLHAVSHLSFSTVSNNNVSVHFSKSVTLWIGSYITQNALLENPRLQRVSFN